MEKILIIEDNETIAKGIAYALGKEGWDTAMACSAQEGYKLFEAQQFSVILLDVMLPDEDGFELCKRIRESSQLPIIFLTACDDEISIVQGLELGGDDYITKPFRVRELISRIKVILRRSHSRLNANSPEIFAASGDIRVFPADMKVFKGKEELILTLAEYRLLMFLMSNPQKPMSRALLISKIWDVKEDFVDDNTLSVYIRRLRAKLERNPSNPEYITTVRGFGYKWNQAVT